MQALAQLLTPGRTVCHVSGLSKKRLFEKIAKVISEDQVSLPYSLVLSNLIAREKLGSTGLGEGIAIPHCRIENCTHPLGTLVTLAEPIEFDSPDAKPVDILFVLLVPDEAQQQHLDILSSIAGLFSQPAFCEEIRRVDNPTALFELATSWTA